MERQPTLSISGSPPAFSLPTFEQLKPYLLDPDRHVRKAVAEYFAESKSRDEDLLPRILDACDRFGSEADVGGLARASEFTVTEGALDRVLAWLGQSPSEDVAYHLCNIVTRAPVSLLSERIEDIRGAVGVPKGTIRRLGQRLRLSKWSDERLWREFQNFARRCESNRFAGEVDHAYADDLVEALGSRSVPDDETIVRLLLECEEEGDWLDIFLIDLAGVRRIREAVPTLVTRFRIDTDYMLERCIDALARIGDPRAVELLGETYPRESWNFRNFAMGVFRGVKSVETENVLLKLLEIERDIGFQTMLCDGLCSQFSARGVEAVRRQVHEGFDEWIVALDEALLPVVHVLGIDLPEAPHWRKRRDECEKFMAERRALLESGETQHLFDPREFAPEHLVASALDGGLRGAPWMDDVDTIVRPKLKVGRNEPCPCGSGKKYKKCCASNKR